MENQFDNQKLSYFLKQYKQAVLCDTFDSDLKYEVITFLNGLYKKYNSSALILGDNNLIKVKDLTIHYIILIGLDNGLTFAGYTDDPIKNDSAVIKDKSVLQMPVKELIPLVYILVQHERRK